MILPEGSGGVDVPPPTNRTDYIPLPRSLVNEITQYPIPPESGPPSPSPHIQVYPNPRQPSHHVDLIPLSPESSQSSLRSPLDRSVSRTPLLDRSGSATPTDTPLLASQLPPALHANFLTSCIGFATIVLLWPPILLLHWTGWETFRWPAGDGVTSGTVWAGLGVVAWSGAFYVSLGTADNESKDIERTLTA